MIKAGITWLASTNATIWFASHRGHSLRLDKLAKHIWSVTECRGRSKAPKIVLSGGTTAREAVQAAKDKIDARHQKADIEANYLSF